jgi:hypothetical protein
MAALRQEFADKPRAFVLAAEGAQVEIRRIQADIARYCGLDEAQLNPPSFWMRLVGPKAQWGDTPASVVTAFLDGIRKGLQSIAAYNKTGQRGGRPPASVQEACDVRVVEFSPGSFSVALKLPHDGPPRQAALFSSSPEHQEAEVAYRDFLTTAEWLGSEHSAEAFAEQYPVAEKRRILLRAVKFIVPRANGGIDFVELSTPSGRVEAALSADAFSRILAALDLARSEEEEEHVGEIREIDLDKNQFRLRNVAGQSGQVVCHFADDLALEARDLLGKRVRVVGVRRAQQALEVFDIENVEASRDSGTQTSDA